MSKIEYEYPDGYKCERVDKKFYGEYYELVHLFKKEEVKDFNWFVDKYFGGDKILGKYRFSEDTVAEIKGKYKEGMYDLIPLELRICLLKLICKEFNYNFNAVMYSIYSDGENVRLSSKDFADIQTILDICPCLFIKSLHKYLD